MKPTRKNIAKIITEKHLFKMISVKRHKDKTTTIKINTEFRMDDRDFEVQWLAYNLQLNGRRGI